jgi:K+-transporting ATPase ATPase C chain
MLSIIRPALVMLAAMTILTGLAYPLAMTGLASAVMPARASGSLIEQDGHMIGSALIGQDFTDPGYLHPRPSAVSYDASAAAASNLGPTSTALATAVGERRAAWEAENRGPAPLDALTSSASGLDPHVSPENARGQAGRIAEVRGVTRADVLAAIADQTEPRWLGLFGEPGVNVLLVNLALDAAFPATPSLTN